MLRLLLAVALVACIAPSTVAATGSPSPSSLRSVPLVTGSPSATPRSSPSIDPANVPKCVASQLQAVAAGVQATDFFAGAVFIANRGTAACTLRGSPEACCSPLADRRSM
jgi:hypothetical protein